MTQIYNTPIKYTLTLWALMNNTLYMYVNFSRCRYQDIFKPITYPIFLLLYLSSPSAHINVQIEFSLKWFC